jgi:hypothetical protein
MMMMMRMMMMMEKKKKKKRIEGEGAPSYPLNDYCPYHAHGVPRPSYNVAPIAKYPLLPELSHDGLPLCR